MEQHSKVNSSIGIGLIGAGVHGARYLKHAANDVPGMHVSALCRRDRESGMEMARELGCRYHQESKDVILAPDVDAVIVCTPPSSHFQLADDVLAAGKPLLLEKPMTGTLQEAEELANSYSDRCVLVGQTLRWNPVIEKVKELWPRLGKVHHIRLAQRLFPASLPWQHNIEETVSGSVLLTGVHLFDLVRHLSGSEFASIDARQQMVLHTKVEDFFLARASLNNGCWVSMEVSKYTKSRACWLEAVGESGQIFADYLVGGVVLREGNNEEKFSTSALVPTIPSVLKHWLDAINGVTTPRVTIADGVATMRIVDACYRSASMEKTVEMT